MATVSSGQKAAITEVRLALKAEMPFDEIVEALRATLTIPELPGFRGCRPCLSGLDRFVVEDMAIRQIR